MGRVDGKFADFIMTEENPEFRNDKKQRASGRITVQEDGGQIMFTAVFNNLLPLDSRRYRYCVMLLGLNHGHSIHKTLGEIRPDVSGDASEIFGLNKADVDGNGNGVDNFSICMLVVVPVMNRREPYRPVLKADNYNRLDELRTEHTDSSAKRTDSSVQHTDLSAQRTDSPVRKSRYTDFYEEYLKEMSRRLIGIKDRCRRLDLFEEKWIAEQWYITEDSKMFPVASAEAYDLVERYKNFLFAFNDEYLLLGVPGRKDEPQPDKGASGFTLWHEIKGSAIYGYWLLAIHRKTGKIVDFQGERGFTK